MNTSFGYRAIVFQLSDCAKLDSSLKAKKLLSYRSVVIAEHPEDSLSECDWNGLHYHGIVEGTPNNIQRFDGDRVFQQFKTELCAGRFKSEQCKLPVNFLAYMQIPPRTIVYRNERNDESDLSMLEAQVTPELIEQVKERKIARINAKKEGSQDIMIIKDLILKSNAQSESELLNIYHNDPVFEAIYCKRTFTTNFKKALNFAIQTTLDTDILSLCHNFEDKNKKCLTPIRSANLVDQWCSHQGIDPRQFCDDMIALLDKKERKRNALIMEGAPNSGKTYITHSMQKACVFFGEVCQGMSGYAFMWQDCVNKRLIVLNEPYFDNAIIEQLKIVLEGTGTFVHKKNCGDEYLRPTPVIITSNNPVWSQCPNAEEAIRARVLRYYGNLKPCDFLKNVRKDLHPRWLPILSQRYARAASPVEWSDTDNDEPIIVETVIATPNNKRPNGPPSIKREREETKWEAQRDLSKRLRTTPPIVLDLVDSEDNSDLESEKQLEVIPDPPYCRRAKWQEEASTLWRQSKLGTLKQEPLDNPEEVKCLASTLLQLKQVE